MAFNTQTDTAQIGSVAISPDTTDPSAWVLCWRRDPEFSSKGFIADGFIRSARFIPAIANATYVLEYEVSLSSGATSCKDIVFSAVPVSLDKAGQIIQSTLAQPLLSQRNSPSKNKVEIVAAADADQIFVGFQGCLLDEKPNVLTVISNVKLIQL